VCVCVCLFACLMPLLVKRCIPSRLWRQASISFAFTDPATPLPPSPWCAAAINENAGKGFPLESISDVSAYFGSSFTAEFGVRAALVCIHPEMLCLMHVRLLSKTAPGAHKHAHTHTHTHAGAHTHTRVCVRAHKYANTHTHACTHTHAHTYACTHYTYTHTLSLTHTHTHTYTHTRT